MENKSKPVGFSLRRITTEQFAVVEEAFSNNETIGLSTSLRFGTNRDSRIISVFALVKFGINKIPFLIIEVGCDFEIDEMSWASFLNNDRSSIHIPKGFITHLAVITIGTARGVLHVKTENTFFNRFTLPTINVTELIKEDVLL